MNGNTTKYCVDPGHGMGNRKKGVFDPGAVFHGPIPVLEAEAALKYGLTLRDAFESRNHAVFMTRTGWDDNAPVGKRARNAESAGCAAFISLHLNSSEDPSAHGLEVLYRDDGDKPFAEKMQDALVDITGLRDRGIKQRKNLAVLKFDGPAILIELGFISNAPDRTKMVEESTKAAVCEKIADVTVGMYP